MAPIPVASGMEYCKFSRLTCFRMDDALKRIGDIIGQTLDWTILQNFLPDGLKQPPQRRAAVAATFATRWNWRAPASSICARTACLAPSTCRRAEPSLNAPPVK